MLVYFYGLTDSSVAGRVIQEVEDFRPPDITTVVAVPEWRDELSLQARKVIADAGWIVEEDDRPSHAEIRADFDQRMEEIKARRLNLGK